MKTGQLKIFKEIWEEREHVSELSGEPLLPFNSDQWHWQFLHVLPKGSYPKWKFYKGNIILGTVDEHKNQDHIKKFVKLRQKLTAEYYKEFYNKTFKKTKQMSVSIMECLQNADYNLRSNSGFGAMFAKEQVHNATVLLDKGYDIWTEVDPLIEKYGTVEDVPELDENKETNQDS